MRRRLTLLLTALAAVTALAVLGSTMAFAGQKAHRSATKASAKQHRVARVAKAQSQRASAAASAEDNSATESDTDGAAQASACQAAGIDPNASNVNYDDQSGKCSLDGSSGSGQ